MKNIKTTKLTALAFAAMLPSAGAVTISLFDYGVNIDGTSAFPSLGDPVPAAVDISAFDTATGLGTVSVKVSTPGNHYVGLYVDHEIDEADNTFFNETGGSFGAAASGQTFEVDEPGFVFGDIFTNFLAGTLDNTVLAGPEDISMALAWDFILGTSEMATIDFLVSQTAPAGGLYLVQADPDSQASLYFSGTLAIKNSQPPTGVPDGGATLPLLLLGLTSSFGFARKLRKSRTLNS